MSFSSQVQQRMDAWLRPPYDVETQQATKALIERDPIAAADAFGAPLRFGTGGMRGIMGVGTNRMNRYTVGSATQGLAQHLLKKMPNPSVFISYDSRHQSQEFAKEAARVLAGNHIRVYLTRALRPTPFVSFGCRYYRCAAAIMITASHNPPEYNGYKVYGSDGAQVVPPDDEGIIEEVLRVQSPDQVRREAWPSPLITLVDEAVDQAYLQAMLPLQNFPEENKRFGHQVKVVYSPLHGAGMTTLPAGLASWGFSNLSVVERQALPDPDFSTTRSPNPEDAQALTLGIEQLLRERADLFFASDPDADRLGVVVLHEGKPVLLTGNQVAALCLYFLCSVRSQKKILRERDAFITTIVTTPLFQAIARKFERPCFSVLTGFKYIGEKIRLWEATENAYQFIFGAEESLGYLYGTQVRDKDATVSACLLTEIALFQKKKGKTLLDLLHKIYREFGFFQEKQLSIPLRVEAAGKVGERMQHLRNHLPEKVAGDAVINVVDYLAQEDTQGDLPPADVLSLHLESQSTYLVRPSGTEPKIKIYGMVHRQSFDEMASAAAACNKQLDTQLAWLRQCYFS